jgi:hypothetical protein
VGNIPLLNNAGKKLTRKYVTLSAVHSPRPPGNVGSRKTKEDSTLSDLVSELKCRDNAKDIECVL